MIGILIIAIPLLMYAVGAFSVAQKDLTNPDDFFIAYKKVGVTAFSSSSIAYAFQVSTIYPFLLWGASNLFFVPALNTIFWGIGIMLFLLCFNRYKKFIGKGLTLHGFIGSQHGMSTRVIASYLTIIGFIGTAIAETYFGSKVLLSIIGDKNLFYLTILIALLFVFGYITYGGQVSSIRTDQLQLITSYIGVFGLMIYFMYLIIKNGLNVPNTLSLSYLIIVIYIPIILAIRKFKFIKVTESDSNFNKYLNLTLNSIVCTLLVLIFGLAAAKLLQSGLKLSVPNLVSLSGFGVLGLLSLTILPLCWQFVDLTNWQRILSVKADNSNNDKDLHQNIRKGLLIYAIESPFTWIIFLFFGILATSALPNFKFQDLLIDIPKELIHSTDFTHAVFGYVFIVSILAIMLSTVDSFIVGIIFTYVYDSNKTTRSIIDSHSQDEIKNNYRNIINTGRSFGLVALLIGITLFVVFDKVIPNGGEVFINLLLAFYSAQLSFIPLIIGILFLKKHPTTFWANASMIIGSLTGITIGIYAVIYNQNLLWYPVVVCFSLSTLVYLVGLFFDKLKPIFISLKRKGFALISNFFTIIFNLLKVIFIFLLTNPVSSVIILLSIGFSLISTDEPRWFNWEIAAFFSSIVYSFYIYIFEGTICGDKFMLNDSRKNKIGWIILCILGLSITALLSINYQTGWINVKFTHSIIVKMGCLWITSILFAITTNMLSKNIDEKDKIALSFKSSFIYSDRPICIGFGVLFVFACIVGDKEIITQKMESFFAGAIAFQMILSNVVWTFTDDNLLKCFKINMNSKNK